MVKSPKSPPASPNEAAEIETEPDAWERFERTMDKVAPPKRPKPVRSPTAEARAAPVQGESPIASKVPGPLKRIMEENSAALGEITSGLRDSRSRQPTEG